MGNEKAERDLKGKNMVLCTESWERTSARRGHKGKKRTDYVEGDVRITERSLIYNAEWCACGKGTRCRRTGDRELSSEGDAMQWWK